MISKSLTWLLLANVLFACALPVQAQLNIVAETAAPSPSVDSQTTPANSTIVVPDDYYPRLHALCIGINRYENTDIPSLSYAEQDASEVAQVLRERFGFTDVVTLLGNDATREKITDQLARLENPDEVSNKDAVLIFFSGHGQTVSGGAGEQGYLLPVDAQLKLSDVHNPAPYRKTAIRMDDLRADADAIPARHVLFLMDACFSGYMATKAVEGLSDTATGLRYPARQVITAGAKGEEALEHHAWKHGAFTYELLELLRTQTKPISAAEIGVQLRRSVPREVSVRYDGKVMTPQCKYLSGEGDFVLIPRGETAYTPSVQQESAPVTHQPTAAPSHLETVLSEGDAFFQQGKFADAVVKYTEIVDQLPTNITGYCRRAAARNNLQLYSGAIEDCEAALGIDQHSAEAFRIMAFSYNERHEYETGIKYSTKALELDPGNAAAYHARAIAYNNVDRYKSAVTDSSKALSLDPRFADAYRVRAYAYGKLNQLSNAIADCTRCIDLDNQAWLAYIMRSEFLSRAGETEASRRDHDRAIEINPAASSVNDIKN